MARMSGAVPLSHVHLPVLGVELPPRWSVAETVSLRAPSGQTIDVSVGPVPLGCGPAEFVDREIDATREIIGSIDVDDPATVELPGGPTVAWREFRFEQNGASHVARVACRVVGEHAIRFVSRWQEGDALASTDFDAAIGATFVLPRTLDIATSGESVGEGGDPVHRAHPSPEPGAWLALRDAWSSGPATGARAELAGGARWSPHELLVAAAMAGADAFPTVGDPLAAATQRSIDAVVETVFASLATRGLAEWGADGRRHPTGELARVVELALAPDLVVWIERTGEGDPEGWWIGVRPDAAIQVAVLAGGGRESAWFDPAAAVDHSLSLIAGAPGLTTVTVLWREGELLQGGTLAWQVDDDGATSVATDATWDDGNEPSWQFAPATTAVLRRCLLDYLPGETLGFSGSEAVTRLTEG